MSASDSDIFALILTLLFFFVMIALPLMVLYLAVRIIKFAWFGVW